MTAASFSLREVALTADRLLEYCRRHNWAGYDPYDALNSRLFALSPLHRSRWCRIGLTQLLKRLPVNLRPMLGIAKEQNAKGIALFLAAALKLERLGTLKDRHLPEALVDRLIALRAPGTPFWCWGYSFPWQTRTVLVPRSAPNLVCTCFVADALLDCYESRKDPRCLEMAVSAAEYILAELYWTDSDSRVGFSYPMPGQRTQVHNANFLAAALLSRVYSHVGDTKFLEPALRAARCSAAAQQADGSWLYGQSTTQGWIDNFHTGYNLCALRSIGAHARTNEFEHHVRAGFDYYRRNFFDAEGVPKYFHDRQFPIDAHCIAQSVLTFLTFRDLDQAAMAKASSVADWAVQHMWNERGFFCYQILAHGTNRISYMRWTQAWMLLALATLLEESQRARSTDETAVA